MPTNLTIQAAGRWIWGSPLKPQIKMNRNVNPPVPALDNNGNKIDQWSFGVAYTKPDFNNLIWPALQYEASTIYPQGTPQDFAWKVKDGDTALDQNGKPLRDREGYAGHMILSISTEAFAPKVVQLMQGVYQQITEGQTALKCGDFFRLALNIVAHAKKAGTQAKPGLYLNPSLVEWIAAGKEIYNGPDAMQIFGGQAFSGALPPGATAPGMAPNMGGGQPGGFNPGQGGGGFPGANTGNFNSPQQNFQQNPGFNPNGGGGNFTQPPQQPNGGGMNPGQQFNQGNPGGGFAPNVAQGQMNPAGNLSSPGGYPSQTAFHSNPQGAPGGFNPNNAAPDYNFANGGGQGQPQGAPGGFGQQQPGPQGFNPQGGFPGQR